MHVCGSMCTCVVPGPQPMFQGCVVGTLREPISRGAKSLSGRSAARSGPEPHNVHTCALPHGGATACLVITGWNSICVIRPAVSAGGPRRPPGSTSPANGHCPPKTLHWGTGWKGPVPGAALTCPESKGDLRVFRLHQGFPRVREKRQNDRWTLPAWRHPAYLLIPLEIPALPVLLGDATSPLARGEVPGLDPGG